LDKDIPKFPPMELVFVEPFKTTAAGVTYQQKVESDEIKYSRLPEASYEKLIGVCSPPITMKHEPIPLKDEGKEIEKAYRKAGRYIADHCDLLLVLWDGVENGKVGGTSDTMEYAKSEECRDNSKVGGPEIHHIVIPQEGNPFPVGVPFEIKKFERKPSRSRWNKLKHGCGRLIRWIVNQLKDKPTWLGPSS